MTEVKNTMPCYKNAITNSDKFYKYSLDSTHPSGKNKAVVYSSALGIDKSNAEILISQIHKAVTGGELEPIRIEESKYGIQYVYRILVNGVDGKTAYVRAIYQIDFGECIPYLVTNYVE